jgi:hypothetical protein
MTFSIPFLNLPNFIILLFSKARQSQSNAETTVPDFEANCSKREFLREMIFTNHEAFQSDYDIAGLMAQYPRQF